MNTLVATTLAAFAMDDPRVWGSWCRNAEAMRREYKREAQHGVFMNADDRVDFFCAIEVDARGLEPFGPLLDRLDEIGGHYWTFSLDDGRTRVASSNRLRHLTMGENLASDYAMSDPTYSHMLFMAADTEPPADAIPKLMEVRWPIVGGEIPGYCLHGPEVRQHPTCGNDFGFPVQTHTPTVAFVLLNREVFRRVKWRWDLDVREGDDPSMYRDCREYLGHQALVRKDCVAKHYPEILIPVDDRGYDMTVVRSAQ